MKFTAVCVMVACATSSVTAVPSFEEIAEEWQSLITNPNVQVVAESSKPVLQQFGIDPSLDLSPTGILKLITSLDNSVVAFHNAVNLAGGRDTFQKSGDALAAAYIGGFLGHLNSENVESAKMAALTADAQAAFDMSVELFYVDLYNLIDSDISGKLINDLNAITVPASKIIADIKDIAAALKEIMGGQHRALFEHVESMSEEMMRVLEDGEFTKDNIMCKLQPIIAKLSDLLVLVSSEQMEKDMEELVKVLSKFPSSNKVFATLQHVSEAIYKFLQAYDPMIHDTVIPLVKNLEKYIDAMCQPTDALQTFAASDDSFENFNPVDIISKAFDFIEKMIEQAEKFLERLPEPLTKEAIQMIYDMIRLIAPEKAIYIKEIVEEISDVTAEMMQLSPVLNTTKDDLALFMADSTKTIEDIKALALNIVALLKVLATKN